MDAHGRGCPVREQLVRGFKRATAAINAIHEEELDLLQKGDLGTLVSMDEQLMRARKERDRAAESLKRHLLEHGCS